MENISYNINQQKFRFERKFLIDKLNYYTLENLIKTNSACFTSIYSKRVINNVYFDTPSLSFYYDNLNGKDQRKKVRIRWYGDNFQNIENPTLEIKIKSGLTGSKKSFQLNSFTLDSNFSTNTYKKLLHDSDLPEDIIDEVKDLKPSLLNKYERKYFLDFTKKFRLTLDNKLQYTQIFDRSNYFRNTYTDKKTFIIELKYNVENDIIASSITGQFPFRITKNSKYVSGIELFKKVEI